MLATSCMHLDNIVHAQELMQRMHSPLARLPLAPDRPLSAARNTAGNARATGSNGTRGEAHLALQAAPRHLQPSAQFRRLGGDS
jgi:hypothetical protein